MSGIVVAVVVASKYGSTREVAEAIAAELRPDHDVQVQDADTVEGFEGAEAVVLGSAIYGGRWLASARKLLEDRADELAARPTWLFSVGPIGEPPKPADAGPEGIAEALQAAKARGHEVFAGKLERARLSRVERLMVGALRAPEGDFRDWDEIGAFARAVRRELS